MTKEVTKEEAELIQSLMDTCSSVTMCEGCDCPELCEKLSDKLKED